MVLDKNNKNLILKWQLRLNHLPFKKLNMMVMQGRIPKKLARVDIPFCPACTYGKAARKPWKGKASNKNIKMASQPGESVLIDSFEWATAGFVAKMKDILTNKHYMLVTCT